MEDHRFEDLIDDLEALKEAQAPQDDVLKTLRDALDTAALRRLSRGQQSKLVKSLRSLGLKITLRGKSEEQALSQLLEDGDDGDAAQPDAEPQPNSLPPEPIHASSDPNHQGVEARLMGLLARHEDLFNERLHRLNERRSERLQQPSARATANSLLDSLEQNAGIDRDDYNEEDAQFREVQPARPAERPFRLQANPVRRLEVRCQREAASIFDDVVARAGSFSAFVAQHHFRMPTYEFEASTLARAIDLIADQFSRDGIKHIDAAEVLTRRLIALLVADQAGGNWKVATFMEERPQGSSLPAGSNLLREAHRMASIMQRLSGGEPTPSPTQSRLRTGGPEGNAEPSKRARGPNFYRGRGLGQGSLGDRPSN